jgi:hypothetical protein
MVAHACNPSYPGDISRKIMVWGQLGQKQEILSEKMTKPKKRWRCGLSGTL